MWFFKDKKVSVCYGITVCNEHEELQLLLAHIMAHKQQEDNVLVLADGAGVTDEVLAVLDRYREQVRIIQYALAGDFAAFKNRLVEHAQADYLFQLDADELPAPGMLGRVKAVLARNRRYDCYSVPRINTVEGLLPQHVAQWNWKLDARGYINYPDYQQRILRLNGRIRWQGRVHEKLAGYRRLKLLPADGDDYCLLHAKTIGRQVRQNAMYDGM